MGTKYYLKTIFNQFLDSKQSMIIQFTLSHHSAITEQALNKYCQKAEFAPYLITVYCYSFPLFF